jgi:GPR1/FUN34/yaaH family
MMLSLWGIFTFILMVPTLELNFALFSLFLTLSILFFLLTGGITTPNPWTKIAGWWGLFVAGIAFYIAAADIINEEMQMTVLPLGKWSVGRPIMRSLRRTFSKIPGFNICTRGAEREDRKAGFTFRGKKGAAAAGAPASQTTSRTDSYQNFPQPVYVDVYTDERETGQPHLYTASEIPASSFEGAAVNRAARKADVRSGFGPY